MQQNGADSLDFYINTSRIYTSRKTIVSAELPSDWTQNWHHVAGIYNGKSISLYIDNKKVAEEPVIGNITNFPFPLNVGKNAETHGQHTSGYLCDAIIDQVGIFPKAIEINELFAAKPDLKNRAALWLDFELEAKRRRVFQLWYWRAYLWKYFFLIVFRNLRCGK